MSTMIENSVTCIYRNSDLGARNEAINTNPDPKVLSNLYEFFASGYFEEPSASPMKRWSRAVQRRFEHRTLAPYNGELLYPCGPAHIGKENRIVSPNYSFTWGYNESVLKERLADATEGEREALMALQRSVRHLGEQLNVIRTPHTVGGRGYTHSVPNYGRVLCDGLSEHSRRISKKLDLARQRQDTERIDFSLGLQDVLAGIERWHQRILEFLRSVPTDNPVMEARRKGLVSAYQQVPFKPATRCIPR